MLFAPLFKALEAAKARYLVVGGVAVVLHGYNRMTADLDLIVDLEPGEAKRCLEALGSLGLQPLAPVRLESFADPIQRERWISEKNMKVFSLLDPANPLLQVDLFATNPMPFEDLWSRAEVVDLADTFVRVASIPDLVQLKLLAGRTQDLADVENLNRILTWRKNRGRTT